MAETFSVQAFDALEYTFILYIHKSGMHESDAYFYVMFQMCVLCGRLIDARASETEQTDKYIYKIDR